MQIPSSDCWEDNSIWVHVTKPKKDSNINAVRVDHSTALIPEPTPQLLNEMAVGIHLAVAGSAAVDRNETKDAFPSWDKLPDNVKEYWIEGARCAFAIVAIHGGAKVKKL